MKIMSRALLILAATALMGTGLPTSAQAATITLENVVTSPTNVLADIVVNDLNEATGGFGLQVAFNAADFSGGTYTADPGNMLGDAADPILDFSFGFGFPGPGFLDLFVIATMTPAQLTTLQGPFPSSFVLASIDLTRSSSTAGSNLSLVNVSLSNAEGTGTIPLGVPDQPTTMWLLGSAVGALFMHRRKAS
jgi:hypothetical protein